MANNNNVLAIEAALGGRTTLRDLTGKTLNEARGCVYIEDDVQTQAPYTDFRMEELQEDISEQGCVAEPIEPGDCKATRPPHSQGRSPPSPTVVPAEWRRGWQLSAGKPAVVRGAGAAAAVATAAAVAAAAAAVARTKPCCTRQPLILASLLSTAWRQASYSA